MSSMSAVHELAKVQVDWRAIPVQNLLGLKRRLKFKHGTMSNASVALNVDYGTLGHVIHGRLRIHRIVAALQMDLELSDEQVLSLWPLLKTWPREVA